MLSEYNFGRKNNCNHFLILVLLITDQTTVQMYMACLLKAEIVEPEKQPLLANGSETTLISRQRPRNKQRNNVRC
jgi:hypothetical protein